MKTNALWLVAVLLLFTGCSSDSEISCPEPFTGPLETWEVPLEGRWELTALEGSVEADLTDDDTDNPSTDLFAQVGECERQVSYVFDANRIMAYAVGVQTAEDFCEEQTLLQGSWSYKDNRATVVTGCSEFYLDIDLNEDGSSFTITYSENVRNYQGETIPMEVTMTLTKVVE